MSRKKHNIAYIKPEEPKFIRDLKAQIGFKEGPDVNTKRQELSEGEEEDFEDRGEEKPQVVVLSKEHLTAEEADEFQKKKDLEEANAPADLSKRIIFNRKAKPEADVLDQPPPKKSKSKKPKLVLSFDDEDE
ncbi:GSCOCG00004094001-RA-CDS [Cotesia congregata]|uniref:DUF4604 domain-containing protein n=2 Tax=Cotesia TaxID=32390 RepID=A0AAV7HTF1_COTGL|nr:uncharacterized protein KIAA1143 homolog [Cotesia glomerata]KAH0535380.1 hypothetical protein KQX54_016092 [Cotesia glomerata]CAD6213486.1 GSCOCG00004094001-RA-CDS [Cotesia congregata]CAG5082273.1 Similar to RCJMB04_19n18: Uncharacterized protein KIAA1143 homolog (Gallus gallus) [Cotesia congregata]